MMMDAVVQNEYSKVLTGESKLLDNEYEPSCCVASHAPELLKKVPAKVLEHDFGCGDPTPFVRSGEVVLDLGSGSGKIAYILSQVVGPAGRVIGVDLNQDMLALAREAQSEFSDTVGYDNIDFFRASIADLRTDIDKLEQLLKRQPVKTLEDYQAFEARRRSLFHANPLVVDGSVDIIVSNCVINLVGEEEKTEVFREMARVLKPGGRIAISDNVSNIRVPENLKSNPALWAGCYSGVLQEDDFMSALRSAGLVGVRIEERSAQPIKQIDSVEFRSVTVTAYKPFAKTEEDLEVYYRGPWAEVVDDQGRRFRRGKWTRVQETGAGEHLPLRALEGEVFSRNALNAEDGQQSADACCPPQPQASKAAPCC